MANTVFTFADAVQNSSLFINDKYLNGVEDLGFTPESRQRLPYTPINSPRTLFNVGRAQGGAITGVMRYNPGDKVHQLLKEHLENGQEIPVSFIARGSIVNDRKSKSAIDITGNFRATVASASVNTETTVTIADDNTVNIQPGDHIQHATKQNLIITEVVEDGGVLKLKAKIEGTAAAIVQESSVVNYTVKRPAVRIGFSGLVETAAGFVNQAGNFGSPFSLIVNSTPVETIGTPDIA